MSGNGNNSGGGGQLVSQLMQEINSGTGNQGAYTDQDYYPQEQQMQQGAGMGQGQGAGMGQGHGAGMGQMQDGQGQGQMPQNFNPDAMVPPPRDDDNEEEDSSDDEDEEYYYKENNLNDTLSQLGGEYTSFIMDLLKNSVIIFIGYIIFSHPFTNNYIMQFASMVPGLREILSVPTYNLAVNGLLFVLFYFAVTYFI